MARALGQAIEPVTEAEKEAACEARRQANRDAMAKQIASRGENKFEAARRAQYHTAEGARRYARMAMANGATTIPADIWQRANGGGRS
jgi:microcystin degradation protein MlrC